MSQHTGERHHQFKRITAAALLIGSILFMALVLGCNLWIITSTRSRVY
jgi:hypothetical protein